MAYPGQISTRLCVVVTLSMVIMDLAVARRNSYRVPRPESIQSSPFTEEEIDELVDWHNFARSSVTPQASNMEYIQWDSYLQDIAQRWADNCMWEHGQPSDVTRHYGQNMWAIAHPGQVKPEGIIASWENEKHFYNFSENSCEQGRKCGHYTQVVWSTTNSVGCGRTFCPKLSKWKNMWIVVCQYSPAGNVLGYSPYVEGPPCSRCSSGVGQCYENLCRSCEDHDEECVCLQFCRNCGKVDKTTCTCDCPGGFHGSDCSKTCSDLHRYCGRTPGFPNRAFCRFHPMIPRLCPKMCGVCEAPDENFECVETTTVQTTEVKTTSSPVYVNDDDDGDDTDVESNTVNEKRSNMHNPMVA